MCLVEFSAESDRVVEFCNRFSVLIYIAPWTGCDCGYGPDNESVHIIMSSAHEEIERVKSRNMSFMVVLYDSMRNYLSDENNDQFCASLSVPPATLLLPMERF